MSRRNILIGVGTVITGLFIAPVVGLDVPSIFSTPGVKNIENRYSAGGGSKHHLPGTATKLGDHEVVEDRQEAGGRKGIGSPGWEERVGEQRSKPGPFDKAWNKTHYGAEKGK